MTISSTSAAQRLAFRLRELREHGFDELAGTRITQKHIADALAGNGGLSVSTVSAWENPAGPPVPMHRLRQLALFYATPRSIADGPQLVSEGRLSADERARFDQLLAELRGLRVAAQREEPRPSVWRFTDDAPITLVCPDGPAGQSREADPEDLDFVWAYTLMDVDALLELHGHLRAENPRTTVQIKRASELGRADVSDHVVVLGAWTSAPKWFRRMIDELDLPVTQEADKSFIAGETGETFKATVDPDDGLLVEDVGLFVRTPNPHNAACTLTLCNGVHTRGVHGAVLCFTDAKHRERNESVVAATAEDAPGYLIVMRIRVVHPEPLTPDLSDDQTVRFLRPLR